MMNNLEPLFTMVYLHQLVKEMRENEAPLSKEQIMDKIKKEPTFTGKCILCRKYFKPQSTNMEQIIKEDLEMGDKINETSGDATKSKINYEIKYSGHAKQSKWNFVQIRPDHNINQYLLAGYNMHDESDENLGKGYVFKVPAEHMYNLIIKYGGYAHGTIKELGKITRDNLKGRNCEYALRCNPNSKKGKGKQLFDELLKYEVEYAASNF